MDDMLRIKTAIKKGILNNLHGFVICPYGKQGKIAKEILNNDFGINEKYIFDERFADIHPSDIDNSLSYVILITTTRKVIRDYYKEQFKCFNNSMILDVFDDYSTTDDVYSHVKGLKNGFELPTLTYQMKSHDVKFFLPFWDQDIIQKHIVRYDEFKDEDQLFWITHVFNDGLVEKRMRQGYVLDVGSNIGNHSLYFSIVCNAKKVFAFEPIKSTYDTLCTNIQINNLQNKISAINCAVGSQKGKGVASDAIDYSNTGGTRIRISPDDEDGTFQIITIDELNFDEDIALMKIDVEGFEKDVVTGAKETIKRNHPIIMLESWDHDDNIVDIMKMLMGLGYKWKQISICDYLFF